MRQIYRVDATQVVVSDAHPEGVYSVVDGYPKFYDSRNYNASAENPDGDDQRALQVAKSEYFSRLSAFLAANNRAKATVTLERSDGWTILRECIGQFPIMTSSIPEQE